MFYIGTGFTYDKNGIQDCTNKYFEALCSNDIKEAKEQVTGQALWSLDNISELPKATIEKSEISIRAGNNKWAKVNTLIEIRLNDETIDVGWYDIDLINTEQGWKIFNLRNQVPEAKHSLITNSDIEEPKKVFEEYLTTTSIEYLAGAARIAQEQNQVKLVPIEYKDLEMAPLGGNKEYKVLKASYFTDRAVNLCVTFYKSIDGWKIVNIQQI
jgi:hypothetical protein